MTRPSENRPAPSVQSVNRTLDLLEALFEAGRPVSLSELSQQVELPPGTTHRLLAALLTRGYVWQAAESRAYSIGFKVIDWASRIGPGQLIDLARPHMQALMEETGETVNLCTLVRNQIVYTDQIASPRMVRMFADLGNRAPIHSTGSGKALLAFGPEAQRSALLVQIEYRRFTSNTITNMDLLERELEKIRACGYSVDDGEFEEGVRCIAAPVLNGGGHSIAAISVSGPASRITPDSIKAFAAKVMRCANRVSNALGFGKPAVRWPKR